MPAANTSAASSRRDRRLRQTPGAQAPGNSVHQSDVDPRRAAVYLLAQLPVNRIDQRFRALRAMRQKGFIVYICAGDPNLKATASLARELERIAVDVLELGVPFSDPLADGVVNQLAAERALRSGTTLPGVLKTIAGLRRRGLQLPVVL